MAELPELALAASGGLDRWRKAVQVRSRLSARGPTFDRVGHDWRDRPKRTFQGFRSPARHPFP